MRDIVFFGAGTAQTGNNTSLTPDLSTDVTYGDLVCILAAVRTGAPRTPDGWKSLAQSGNVAIFGRIWRRGDTMPTVTFVGSGAGDDTMVRSFAMRNVPANIDTVVHSIAVQSNASAQNIAVPGITTTINGCLLFNLVFKADDYTSLARTGYSFSLSLSSTIGNDASCGIMSKYQGTAGVEAAGTVTVTGGASAGSIGITLAIAPFETTYAAIPATNRPCDFAADFTTGSDGACAAFSAIDANLAILKNPPVVSISATPETVTSDGLVSFSSVDIDPTGIADLVSDPNSFTLTSGRWIVGWYGQIANTVTFNGLLLGDGSDFLEQTQVFDMDAAFRYPADENHSAGGGSMSVMNMESVTTTSQMSMGASFTGSVPGSGSFEVTMHKAVQYAFRVSD